jgi:hypothetical protein
MQIVSVPPPREATGRPVEAMSALELDRVCGGVFLYRWPRLPEPTGEDANEVNAMPCVHASVKYPLDWRRQLAECNRRGLARLPPDGPVSFDQALHASRP